MAGIPVIYKGDDAAIMITGMTHSILAISDFSLTLDKGVAEQELLGSVGNYFVAGSLSCDISLTACKLHSTAIGKLVKNLLLGVETQVSGSCGPLGLHFCLEKCYVTGFDFTLGAGGDITEGTIDLVHLEPYNISVQRTAGFIKVVDN